MKRYTLCFWVTLAIGLLSVSGFAQGSRFRSDDPLAVDPDQLPIPQPEEIELSQTLDVLANTFALRPPQRCPDSRGGEHQHTGRGTQFQLVHQSHEPASDDH